MKKSRRNKSSSRNRNGEKKKKVSKKVSSQRDDSSEKDEYAEESDGGNSTNKTVIGNGSVLSSTVTVICSNMVKDTPRIRAKGFMSKSGRKYRSVLILPDSGATITLVHCKIVKRLGLKVKVKGGEDFDLYDTKGTGMKMLHSTLLSVRTMWQTAKRTWF